jgi:hypothetical protein
MFPTHWSQYFPARGAEDAMFFEIPTLRLTCPLSTITICLHPRTFAYTAPIVHLRWGPETNPQMM